MYKTLLSLCHFLTPSYEKRSNIYIWLIGGRKLNFWGCSHFESACLQTGSFYSVLLLLVVVEQAWPLSGMLISGTSLSQEGSIKKLTVAAYLSYMLQFRY